VIVRWTPEAVDDLARLHDFIADYNPHAAIRVVTALRNAVRQHPLSRLREASHEASGSPFLLVSLDPPLKALDFHREILLLAEAATRGQGSLGYLERCSRTRTRSVRRRQAPSLVYLSCS